MLYEFLTAHREEIIARCRAKVAGVAGRTSQRAPEGELGHGVPIFLDQLVETLCFELNSGASLDPSVKMGESAIKNGNDLLRIGITVAQVVHAYGDVCQSVTELAMELDSSITTQEFRTLNRCLDDAIAEAVTEYERQHEQDLAEAGTERLGVFSHELRNLLNTASLSFAVLKNGRVGVGGITGAVLAHSLDELRGLVNRSLAEVRLEPGFQRNGELMLVDGFIEEVEASAAMDARAHGLEFSVHHCERGLAIKADRQVLASVVANLLQNAFKFTRPRGHVSLSVRATADRVLIEIEDECGGLAAGKTEKRFHPFKPGSADGTGLGLGLTICLRGVQASGGAIHVRDLPGTGCIFTIDLPKQRLAVGGSHVPASSQRPSDTRNSDLPEGALGPRIVVRLRSAEDSRRG